MGSDLSLAGLDKTQWLLAANKLGLKAMGLKTMGSKTMCLKTKSIKKDFFRLPYAGLSGIQIYPSSFKLPLCWLRSLTPVT